MKENDFYQRIDETIEMLVDNPRLWITKNEAGIKELALKNGAKAFFAALAECVRRGKLDFFINDFSIWLARAENAAPLQRGETEAEYFSRQGNEGSMAKGKTIAEQKREIEAMPEAEKAEVERQLALLKKKYRVQAK
jgi:hypothetical protein